MGPYGMDRTVHCFDFYDCANGLGEYGTPARDSGVGRGSSSIPPRSPAPASGCEV